MIWSGQFSDYKLQCGAEIIDVHKMILAARSPFFVELMMKNPQHCVITNIDMETLRHPGFFYASPNIAFHNSSKINGIMYFFGCLFSKPLLTIGVQNLKTIEKPLKAMVWGLKIIKWRWLNDPKTIEKPSSPMVSY